MLSSGFGIGVLENDRGVPQGIVLKASTHQRRAIRLGSPGGDGQVDQPVIGEIGMQRDVEQSALPEGQYRRQTSDRFRVESSIANQAQTSGTFRDQR